MSKTDVMTLIDDLIQAADEGIALLKNDGCVGDAVTLDDFQPQVSNLPIDRASVAEKSGDIGKCAARVLNGEYDFAQIKAGQPTAGVSPLPFRARGHGSFIIMRERVKCNQKVQKICGLIALRSWDIASSAPAC